MFFNPSVKDAVKNFQEAQKLAGEVLQSLTPGSGVYDLFAAISKGEPPKGSSWGFLILGALGDIPGLTELKGLKIVKAFEKGAEVAGDVGKAGKAASKGAYETALEGGKHAGFLKQYLGKTNAELQKGITSIEKQIAEHQAKIANPESAIPNFRRLDPRQQQALITQKWPSDIARQQEQLDILRGILGGR